MRQRRDPMANVVRRTWTERIDDKAFAAIAEFSETYRGHMFAASTFLLWLIGQISGWAAKRVAKEKAEAKLQVELRRGDHQGTGMGDYHHHRHGMPMVGKIRDLNRP